MSTLVDVALRDAGLTEVLALRRAGRIGDIDEARVRAADLLVLGSLADRIRRDEVGDEVRIYAPSPEQGSPGDGTSPASPGRGRNLECILFFPRPGEKLTGLELLREVAVARVVGTEAARIRVDWVECGLELAQVALGFGANELAGYLASKRGLPFADGALLGIGKKSRLEPALLVKQKELAGLVRRAGRTPLFVGSGDAGEAAGDSHDAWVEEAT